MTPNRTHEVTSIASIVGDDRSLDGKSCVDACNREWIIHPKHSGCSLSGKNTEAFIPYWTCYYIELPGLRLGKQDYRAGTTYESPSLLEELLRHATKDGDLFRDTTQGLLWVAHISEYGLQLNGYDDNHWLPMKSLSILSFGALTKLSSKAQRQARKLERLV